MQPVAVEGEATGCLGTAHWSTDPNQKTGGLLVRRWRLAPSFLDNMDNISCLSILPYVQSPRQMAVSCQRRRLRIDWNGISLRFVGERDRHISSRSSVLHWHVSGLLVWKEQLMHAERRAILAQNSKQGLPKLPMHGASSSSAAQDAKISQLIEGEIIPRLLMAHRRGAAAPTQQASLSAAIIREQDVAYIAELALDHDADMLFRHMTQLESRGISTEQILIDCIAPAATLLGERWEEDQIDFIDVTMAVWRLQESVHILSSRRPGRAVDTSKAHKALFSVMPEDQHNLGTQIVDECFRRAGWETICLMATTESDLLTTVRQTSLDLVGLGVTSDAQIDELPRLIEAIRAASSNPRLVVMLGGRTFHGNTGLAVRLGADGATKDARAAVEVANSLLHSIAAQSDAAI